MADVHGDDVGGAAEQDGGEAAGGRADGERAAAARVDREGVERAGELHAAAADVRVIGDGEIDARVLSDRRAGLGHDLAVDRDLAREDQRARPLTRRRQPAFNEDHI